MGRGDLSRKYLEGTLSTNFLNSINAVRFVKYFKRLTHKITSF